MSSVENRWCFHISVHLAVGAAVSAFDELIFESSEPNSHQQWLKGPRFISLAPDSSTEHYLWIDLLAYVTTFQHDYLFDVLNLYQFVHFLQIHQYQYHHNMLSLKLLYKICQLSPEKNTTLIQIKANHDIGTLTICQQFIAVFHWTLRFSYCCN